MRKRVGECLTWRGSSSGSLLRGDLREPKGALQIPPLRFAPVGMTKGRVALPFRFDIGMMNSRSLLWLG